MKYAKNTLFNLSLFFQCQKYPKKKAWNSETTFSPTGKYFFEKVSVPKKVSACKTTFSQAESSYESEGGTLRPNESFEKTQKAEQTLKRWYPQLLGKFISSTESKSNKEVTLKTREIFPWQKNSENQNCGFFSRILSKFLNLGKSLSAEKTISCQLCMQNAVVSAENREMELRYEKSRIVPKIFLKGDPFVSPYFCKHNFFVQCETWKNVLL